jgi:hypothetical protein
VQLINSNRVWILFFDHEETVAIKQDDKEPFPIDKADMLIALWSAIRRGYFVHQDQEPNGDSPGIIALASESYRERIVREATQQSDDELVVSVRKMLDTR